MSKSKPDKYSVNYSISYGVDVSRKEIEDQRALFDNTHTHFSIFNITITKDSTDKEIAKFIALENPKDREAVDLEDLEVESY